MNEYIIKKHINRVDTYKFYAIKKDWFTFEDYFENRNDRRKTCFDCGHKFKNDDLISVLFTYKGKNKVVCDKCGLIAEDILNEVIDE